MTSFIRYLFVNLIIIFILVLPATKVQAADVTVSFPQPRYTYEIESSGPVTVTISGIVQCSTNTREVLVNLQVNASEISCSIDPTDIQFPRGSSSQQFSVYITIPEEFLDNFNTTVQVSASYRYVPGPSMVYMIGGAETVIELIQNTSAETNTESDINQGDTNNTNYIIPIGFVILILIAIIVIVFIMKRKRSLAGFHS